MWLTVSVSVLGLPEMLVFWDLDVVYLVNSHSLWVKAVQGEDGYWEIGPELRQCVLGLARNPHQIGKCSPIIKFSNILEKPKRARSTVT